MSAMPVFPLAPPALPGGWTEHIGPAGQTYYYNPQTGESTYIRPLPSFPTAPGLAPPPKRKERPLVKTKIPGTDWLRVKTTEGNIFFSHKVTKESKWTVPEEIKDAVRSLEQREKEEQAQRNTLSNEEEGKKVENDHLLEIERIKAEVQEMVKRKAQDVDPVDEVIVTKKLRTMEDDDGDDGCDDSEEEWQREAAAQLAAEAEVEKIRVDQEAQRAKEAEDKQTGETSQIHMPERVDLSVEEAKALFKTLLSEKDINPLHPWETSLPKFVSDPRYVLLPSVSARREAFDEYCRDRARELRQTNTKKEKDAAKPREEFERLLREEVESSRTLWTDFRRTWKKDRRFYAWGRDDRERERRFREYTKELGEKKRVAAQKAEADFFSLLRERGSVKEGSIWSNVKRQYQDDSRYDAVGSSSLREELFNTFLKASESSSTSMKERDIVGEEAQAPGMDATNQEQIKKEKTLRAVKEREDKVRMERGRLDAEIGRSRMGLDKEEGEREFKSLLTDAIRDPQMRWDAVIPQLKTDSRFRTSPLSLNQQLHLFQTHIGHLHSKHIINLHALFQSQAPSLANTFASLHLPSLLSSQPVTKLGLDINALEQEFDKWQRERTAQSRVAFDEMLSENSFIEFWGRLNKIGGEGVDGGVKADDLEEEEGEGGGGKVDMKVLAKNVDVQEMEKVLKNDKRYIMFDHVPSQRERWIRAYLSQLSAPKLSVHLQQTT